MSKDKNKTKRRRRTRMLRLAEDKVAANNSTSETMVRWIRKAKIIRKT